MADKIEIERERERERSNKQNSYTAKTEKNALKL